MKFSWSTSATSIFSISPPPASLPPAGRPGKIRNPGWNGFVRRGGGLGGRTEKARQAAEENFVRGDRWRRRCQPGIARAGGSTITGRKWTDGVCHRIIERRKAKAGKARSENHGRAYWRDCFLPPYPG